MLYLHIFFQNKILIV